MTCSNNGGSAGSQAGNNRRPGNRGNNRGRQQRGNGRKKRAIANFNQFGDLKWENGRIPYCFDGTHSKLFYSLSSAAVYYIGN